MRKILLTGTALMMFAAASYAQINQDGVNQFAQQNQAAVNQTGTINQLQNGGTNYGNYAVTFQGPGNLGPQVANINQNGDGSPTGGSQGNRAGITQTGGPDNFAQIDQNSGARGISGGGTQTANQQPLPTATLNAAGGDGNFAGILQGGEGANNVATIAQSNNSRLNFSEVYQFGNNLTATVSQSNNSINNDATINQGALGANISQVTATITQGPTGATDVSVSNAIGEAVNSTAAITQTAGNAGTTAAINQGASADVDGDGAVSAGRSDGSNASIVQSSNNVTAIINQGNESGESIGSQAAINQSNVNNTAEIAQGALFLGVDLNSRATIVQSGTNSDATIAQGFNGQSDSDVANIYQTNLNNSGFIFQGFGGSSFSGSDVATILQNGTNGFAQITQNSVAGATGSANGRNNVAGINQQTSANNSQAVIDQGRADNGEAAGAIRNLASINQANGNNLRARISQGFQTVNDAAGNSTATRVGGFGTGTAIFGAAPIIGTTAFDGTAVISQTSGNAHNANIFQSGRFNTATIAQTNGTNSEALIIQTNSSQRAIAAITQSGPGTNNRALISQFNGSNADGRDGFGNQAFITQNVGSNNLGIIQQGEQTGGAVQTSSNDNFAQLTQNGSNNTARMVQVGSSNYFNITQLGNGNLLSGVGAPTDPALQQGFNNRLTLVQDSGSSGVGRTYTYTQIGNNNVQVVNQVAP